MCWADALVAHCSEARQYATRYSSYYIQSWLFAIMEIILCLTCYILSYMSSVFTCACAFCMSIMSSWIHSWSWWPSRTEHTDRLSNCTAGSHWSWRGIRAGSHFTDTRNCSISTDTRRRWWNGYCWSWRCLPSVIFICFCLLFLLIITLRSCSSVSLHLYAFLFRCLCRLLFWSEIGWEERLQKWPDLCRVGH